MQIKNKTVILTGAARVGQDVAKALSDKGANLVIVYFTRQPDLKVPRAIFVQADLTKPDDISKVIETGKKEFGQIHGLVHMAASYDRTPWEEINDQSMQKSMWAILRSAVLMSKSVGDELLKNESNVKGKIILFSDWSVLTQPYKDYLPYNVAKSAVVGLTKSLAKELAPSVHVNCIAPGPILRPDNLSDEENAEVLKNTPLKKWGGPGEIAKAVLYLMDTDFMTGQVLYVDGGRSIA